MHERISPITTGMEYYARAFSAFLMIQHASEKDLCRLTGLDHQIVRILVNNLEKKRIVRREKNGYSINIETEQLLALMEHERKEFKWIYNKAKTENRLSTPLACAVAARY